MAPDRRPPLAGFGARVGAALVDLLILWGLVLTLGVIAAAASVGIDGGSWWVLALLVGGVYYAMTMTRTGAHNGQTIGKEAANIRVVRNDGRPVTLKTVALREGLMKLVAGTVTFGAFAVLDSLWALGDRETRALHDHAARTHVVSTAPPRVRIAPPAWAAPAPQLAPVLARHVYAARAIEARIRQLPYPEVSFEIGSLVGSVQSSAQRAQLLWIALADTPVAAIEHRLAQLHGSGKTELIGALESQLAVQRRMQAQLTRYEDELERVVVELDTVRGNLLSMSASSDVENQRRLAERVRSLRDEMGAVAEGFSQAYG